MPLAETVAPIVADSPFEGSRVYVDWLMEDLTGVGVDWRCALSVVDRDHTRRVYAEGHGPAPDADTIAAQVAARADRAHLTLV